MRKSAINDDVLSTREAAEQLGVALRTVQLWVEGGVLPAWKTAGGHRRISRAAVERLIAERRAALHGDAEPPRPQGRAGRLQVLVVDDEEAPRELLRLAIERWGLPLDVDTATNGFDALLRMGRRCPDVLIADLNMPGMNGFRMLEALRDAGDSFARMDVIVVSALDDAQIAARGGLPPDVTRLSKPIDLEALQRRVRERLALALVEAPALA